MNTASTPLPISFEVRSAVDKNGRPCMIVSFDAPLFEERLSEITACMVQASFIPELRIQSVTGHAWHYDIICIPHPELSQRDVCIDKLQEELIGVIASLSLHNSKARKPVAAKKARPAVRRSPARKMRVVK